MKSWAQSMMRDALIRPFDSFPNSWSPSTVEGHRRTVDKPTPICLGHLGHRIQANHRRRPLTGLFFHLVHVCQTGAMACCFLCHFDGASKLCLSLRNHRHRKQCHPFNPNLLFNHVPLKSNIKLHVLFGSPLNEYPTCKLCPGRSRTGTTWCSAAAPDTTPPQAPKAL